MPSRRPVVSAAEGTPKTDTGTTPLLTIAGGQALVRLNRPAVHNRLEPADVAALREIFDRIDADKAIRVLVLTGTGKSFSSGFHIGALAERNTRKPGAKADPEPDHKPGDQSSNAFELMVDALETLRVPTIAALNGGVYGGSTDLALACDFRFGVPECRMFMPASRLGIVYYASGLRRYVDRLGLAAAKKLFLTAEALEAEEMARIGYLDEIVPADQLMARVDALCATLARNAPMSLAAHKQALNALAAGTLDVATLAQVRRACAASDDHQEALAAWAAKRPAVFKGA